MRGKTTTAVRSGLAFLLVLLAGRPVRRFFRFFLLGFRRGISRAFLPGQLCPRLRGGLGNPRLQFPGVDLFRTRTKEAPFVNGHRVLQVASNAFQLLNLSLEGLLFGLPGLGLGLQDLCLRLKGIPLASQGLDLLAQAPVLRRQPFLGGRTHGHNLWRARGLRG